MWHACSGATKGRNFGKWYWGTPLEKRFELACSLIDKSSSAGRRLNDLYNYVGVDIWWRNQLLPQLVGKAGRWKSNESGAVWCKHRWRHRTIAAIAGAVCGAYSGINAFDADMIKQLEMVTILTWNRKQPG